MRRIPEFYRFDPVDHALVDCLSRKVRGEAQPFEGSIKEMTRHDIYGGGKQPWDIFAMHAEYENTKAVFLFTTTTTTTHTENGTGMVDNNSSNVGAWKEDNGISVPVENPCRGNQVVGFKKTFLYGFSSSSTSNEHNVGWLMTEYTTLQPPKVPSLDYVLCKIKKIEFEDEQDCEYETEESEDEQDCKYETEAATATAAAAA